MAKLAWVLAAAVAVVGVIAAARAVGRDAAHQTESVVSLARSAGGAAAGDAAAQNVATAIPAADAYRTENGSFEGLTTAALQQLGYRAVVVAWARTDAACVESTVDGQTASAVLPAAALAGGPCGAPAP